MSSSHGVECSTWGTHPPSRAPTSTRVRDVQDHMLELDCACRWTKLSGIVTAGWRLKDDKLESSYRLSRKYVNGTRLGTSDIAKCRATNLGIAAAMRGSKEVQQGLAGLSPASFGCGPFLGPYPGKRTPANASKQDARSWLFGISALLGCVPALGRAGDERVFWKADSNVQSQVLMGDIYLVSVFDYATN